MTVDLVFNQLGAGNVTANNNLGNPFQLANLTLNSAGGGLKIGNTAGNTLQFVDNGIGVGIAQNGIGVAEISAGVNWLATPLTVSGAGFGNLRLTGALSSLSTELFVNNPQPLPYTGLIELTQPNIMPGATLFAGNLVLNNNQALGNQPITINGGTIGGFGTLPNAITLNAPLIFNGLGQMNLNGVVSGNQPLILRPLGGNTLELRGANTYSGPTSIELSSHGLAQAAGTLVLGGTAGSALNSPSFTLNGGGGLMLGSFFAPGNNNNRIADTASVSISGGMLTLLGAASTSTSEQIGPLSGRGTVSVVANAAAAGNTGTTLTAASLTRNERAQFFFSGNSLGAPLAANVANVVFTAAPGPLVGGSGGPGTTTIPILPYAVGDDSPTLSTYELVTYGANGIRPLAASEYATSITSGTVTQNNVKLTSAAAITSPTTVNALFVGNGGFFTGSTSTLTVTSGTVVGANTVSGTSIPTGMTLNFGAAEANIFVPEPGGMFVDGALTGSNGLSKAGAGSLTLFGNTNVTGTLTINRGAIQFFNAAALNSFSDIVVNGSPVFELTPGLAYVGPTTTVSVTVNKPLTVTDGYARLGGGGASTTFTFSGQISGAGGVLTLGSNLALTNVSNNYTGTTRVFAGNLLISSDSVLGNGGGVVFGGTLGTVGPRLTGDWTTSRQIQFTMFGNQVDTNGFTWTVNSPVTGETPTINKIGAGAWVLTQGGALGQSTTGALATTTTINVNAGELRVTNPTGSATGTAIVNINSGGTLAGTGNVAGATTVASGGFVAPGVSSIGDLSLGSSLTLNGTYLAEANATTSDQLIVRGGLTLGASSILNLSGTFAPGTTYSLAMFQSGTGTFGTVNNLPVTHMLLYQSNQIVLTPVPEPTMVLLASSVGLGLWCFRQRRLRPTIRNQSP